MASTAVETVSQTTFSARASSPRDVQTTLNYYKDPGDGSLPAPSIMGKPETYFRPPETLAVTIHDIRGSEDQYTLDNAGFQLYNFPSEEKTFDDEERIKSAYYAETERLLKEATGASKVFIFDHTIRRPERGSDPSQTLRGPVQRVHIDQSYQASLNRVSYHLPDEAEELLKGRVQIINVWRPIKTIFKDPLGVADAHSVPESDLVPQALVYPDRSGETYTIRPNKAHKWYYAYGQKPEEVTLIKCFDSKTDGRARRVPHSAFVNPATEDADPRQSIEIRALVFHPDDRA